MISKITDRTLSMGEIVLSKYRDVYPESLTESLTPHVSLAPNHPSVDPYHVDDKILKEMNAADYCGIVKKDINLVRKCQDGERYKAILINKYISMDPITEERQALDFRVDHVKFNKMLNEAKKDFTQISLGDGLIYLYTMLKK